MTNTAKKTSSLPVGFIYDDIYLKHDTGRMHPEKAGRLMEIVNHFSANGLLEKLATISPEPCPTDMVNLVHSKDYIKTVENDVASGACLLSTGDTEICSDSFKVALYAAGGAITAVDSVISGKVNRAFCAVRPPGHHATPEAGMGFCIFNNAAIAARYAQSKHGIGKVLIVDWDVHHGNGTQNAFYEDGSVFYASTHQNGIYPMPLTGKGYECETGEGKGKGANMNQPLPYGSGDMELLHFYMNKLLPKAKEFRPELVIISAGFDSRMQDPLGGFAVTDKGFDSLTKVMKEIAGESANGRIISFLEGGYNPQGLAKSAHAHVQELLLP